MYPPEDPYQYQPGFETYDGPTYYHGTIETPETEGEWTHVNPGHGANFSESEPGYAYATTDRKNAEWYAEQVHERANVPWSKPVVYAVEPTGPHEEDPRYRGEYSRGNFAGDRRSKFPWEIVDRHELPGDWHCQVCGSPEHRHDDDYGGCPEMQEDGMFHGGAHEANILDPIQDTLDPTVWEEPGADKPRLKPEHRKWIISTIYRILDEAGYEGAERWGKLYLTGSLTTYQYSGDSDVDVSLFVDAKVFPEWSRAEIIGLMIEGCDGLVMPGTTHELQTYVVAKGIEPRDLYKKGLRSGYDVLKDEWFQPPQRALARDTKREEYEAYTQALIVADKMERLLRYEPDKAVMYYKQLHRKRQKDQAADKGDFAQSNLSYKMLEQRGLAQQVHALMEK